MKTDTPALRKSIFWVSALTILLAVFPLFEPFAQNIVIPANFNWGNMPVGYKGKTLVITHHFKTSSIDIHLPENAVLLFKGGSISGFRSMRANNNVIQAGKGKIFDTGSNIQGTFAKTEARPEWFGAKGDGIANDGMAVETAIRIFGNVRFSGKYFIHGIRIKTTKNTRLSGDKNSLVKGDGSVEGFFDVYHSLCVENIAFENFRYGFYFNQENTIKDIRFYNCTFSQIEKPVFAPISNTSQTLTGIKISGNRFSRCTAGVELFARLNDVVIEKNQFLDLGDPSIQKQSNAIRLGNTAHNYHIDKQIGDYLISDNIIRNVRCGQNLQGGEGFECHGIFALGNRVTIKGNTLENIYNGGVKQSTRIKTGSEGIYVKANDCVISNNTLLNAGFGEGSVAIKGFNTNVRVTNNSIRYTEDLADYAQLITAYFSGEINIRYNILQSVASNTIAIKLCGTEESPVKAMIISNILEGISGWGFKIINQTQGSVFNISGNSTIRITGDVLSEESKKSYQLIFSDNVLTVQNGSFLPSSKMNDLRFAKNGVRVGGIAKTNTARGKVDFTGNTVTVESSANESFLIFYGQALVEGNTFLIKGGWRFYLAFDGDKPAIIQSNLFDVTQAKSAIERMIYINHSVPGLVCTLTGNRFIGVPASTSTILVSVSNKGLAELKMEKNEADAHNRVFLELMAPVGKAHFLNNKTQSKQGFTSTTSLAQLGKYTGSGNSQLPDSKQ